jgi:hypothetical protein
VGKKKTTQPQNDVLAALQKAAAGLKYTSETEAELTPFLWDDGAALTPKHLRELAGVQGAVEDAVPPEDRAKFDRLRSWSARPATASGPG